MKNHEALRVADALEVDKWHVTGVTLQTAAELLREQHEEIERLRIVNLEHEILSRDRARINWIEANLGRFRVTDNGFIFVEVDGRRAGGNDLREALDAVMAEERKP